MFKLIYEHLWPRIDRPSPQELLKDEALLEKMRESVRQSAFSNRSSTALEEARRLFDAEQERRRSADTKAGIYLAAITALVPVLAAIWSRVWSAEMDMVLAGISVVLFLSALLYLLRAGLWAFSTIKVSAFSQLGPYEIAVSWKSKNPEEQLSKKLLNSVACNFRDTNRKVTCIKMTHEFLLRAFFCLLFIMVLHVTWPILAALLSIIYKVAVIMLSMCSP
ncbi:hypothetical protein [Haliea sp.]|jgi:hypothetical protein|uniref:hypothetical protein n=1 Tax=Haliea sp. TaxID=1932666 RepID=UPI000C47FCAD|nr:hypothetical protein [Haliea sp.]MAD65034.1 hypothetical protein [Haliea sp.]MAY94514.1 hypothetical protein [Haliea sp.]MBP71519.1 hypothetical protein [Haliea sp.]|tara:strand:- start:16229 stop:16891 length:663 start_codon:yes stop_codon:yes gene_type:complete